jgi:HlyD family secretion protein
MFAPEAAQSTCCPSPLPPCYARENLESAQTAFKNAEGALHAAEFAVAAAEQELRLADARLQAPPPTGRAVDVVAPVDGVVLKRRHESESVVPAGLIEIGDPLRLEIVADLLSTDAVRVMSGSPVLIERWGGKHPLHARVRRVEPSGFMKVAALGVEEQRVNVIVDLAEPSVAVFLVENSRVRKHIVELGPRNGNEGQIISGVQAGQMIVLHPPDMLTDGTRITERRN